MAIRAENSDSLVLNTIDQISNRAALRNLLLNQWMLESPNTKYRYFVENLSNGNRIYLERPGRLNKGCDFVIYLENHYLFKNGNDRPTPHNIILDDLAVKKKILTLEDWALLNEGIKSIYNCEPFQISSAFCENLPILGESYELILKTLRWFFIEQDITYWLGQGREVLLNKITDL